MRHLITILILTNFFMMNIANAQGFKMTIHPIDDASEHRQEYKSLYNYTSYWLDSEKDNDSLIFITDTTKMVVRKQHDMWMLDVKDTIGLSTLTIVNSTNKKILYKRTFQILNRDLVSIKINKELLKKNKILSIKLICNKGFDCSKNYKIAFIEYQIQDNKDSVLLHCMDNRLTIKKATYNQNICKGKKIVIRARLINRANGLSLMAQTLRTEL